MVKISVTACASFVCVFSWAAVKDNVNLLFHIFNLTRIRRHMCPRASAAAGALTTRTRRLGTATTAQAGQQSGEELCLLQERAG